MGERKSFIPDDRFPARICLAAAMVIGTTPNLDRLAEQESVYKAYTTASVPSQPGRVSLGCLSSFLRVMVNFHGCFREYFEYRKRLSDHGVHTAYIGKWHLRTEAIISAGQMSEKLGMRITGMTQKLPGGAYSRKRVISRRTDSIEKL